MDYYTMLWLRIKFRWRREDVLDARIEAELGRRHRARKEQKRQRPCVESCTGIPGDGNGEIDKGKWWRTEKTSRKVQDAMQGLSRTYATAFEPLRSFHQPQTITPCPCMTIVSRTFSPSSLSLPSCKSKTSTSSPWVSPLLTPSVTVSSRLLHSRPLANIWRQSLSMQLRTQRVERYVHTQRPI